MRKMNAFLLLMVAGVIFVCACVPHETAPPRDNIKKEVIGTEEIGGKYNLTLLDTEVTINNRTSSMKMIHYVKDGKVIEPDIMLPDNMRPACDWIRENTQEDVVVFSWWDYGHMIRAYAEREPVIDAPSREILATTVSRHIGKSPDEIECPDCTPHAVIRDVSEALLAEDSKELAEIMKKYGASVFYAQNSDKYKSFAFYVSVGEEPKDPDSDEFFKTVIGMAARAENIDGFELAYSDETARVYFSQGIN